MGLKQPKGHGARIGNDFKLLANEIGHVAAASHCLPFLALVGHLSSTRMEGSACLGFRPSTKLFFTNQYLISPPS
jgi:hypothetical protein